MCRPNDDGHNIWVSGEEKKMIHHSFYGHNKSIDHF